MNLLRLAIYEVVYYGPVAWFAFLTVAFCASRYVGWIGALLYPTVVAVIIVFLDVVLIECTLQVRTRNQDEDQSISDSSLGRISRCGMVHGTLKIGTQ